MAAAVQPLAAESADELGHEMTQLSEAIDQGLATLSHNPRPEGWRKADFETLYAWVSPECPELLGEIRRS